MHIITSFIAGLGLGVFLSLSVGPVIFMIIKYSINSGFKAGLSFAIGVSFSDTMYVILGNFASTFVHQLDLMREVIGLTGGIVLIAIGLYGIFFKQVRISSGENPERKVLINKGGYLRIWFSGWVMNTLNPGVLIFWLTVCTANGALELKDRAVLFGTTLAFMLSADITKVFLAHKIRHKLTFKTVSWLNRIASVAMIIFGAILIYVVLFHVQTKFMHT
ncbi:MAG: lysine transporter LysE [Chitinophagaceae bacterium]|jgi:threonine/homoserine/homoserine lactone efflux protein|nr:MAG: lysine transporter LysE [Chitinophagaceae bacterium]